MTSDKGWTLVARFSNNDAKNWMKDNGEYWYDRRSAVGQTTNPAHNANMISPAFWSVKGTEFKETRNKVGFWCDWDGGDGAVMMIGGGGSSCSRADHGVGITETDKASFVEQGNGATEFDFGFDADTSDTPSSSYALNLWVR